MMGMICLNAEIALGRVVRINYFVKSELFSVLKLTKEAQRQS